LVAGNAKQAYDLWKPSESYKIGDFMADWGPEGYYGPVKSYSIVKAASGKWFQWSDSDHSKSVRSLRSRINPMSRKPAHEAV